MSNKIWKRRNYWFAAVFALLLAISILFFILPQGKEYAQSIQNIFRWMGLVLVVSFSMLLVAVYASRQARPKAGGQKALGLFCSAAAVGAGFVTTLCTVLLFT